MDGNDALSDPTFGSILRYRIQLISTVWAVREIRVPIQTPYILPRVSSSGIGAWKQVASYTDAAETNCAYSSGYIYCVGGFDGSSSGETPEVNYASLSSLASSSP